MQVLSGLAGAITNATQVPMQCMNLAASWVDSPADMDSQLYCAWHKAGCAVASLGHNPPGSIRSLYLHHAASCCIEHCFMLHASCFMLHASCLMPHASCLMPHASCLNASQALLHASCLIHSSSQHLTEHKGTRLTQFEQDEPRLGQLLKLLLP